MLLHRGYFILLIFFMSGCSIQHFGKSVPPTESYWYKNGYSLSETKSFLYNNCRYGDREGRDIDTLIIETDICMLENGFAFMEENHNIEEHGYRPLIISMCLRDPDGFVYNTPGCQSFRLKHPGSKKWYKRLFGLY